MYFFLGCVIRKEIKHVQNKKESENKMFRLIIEDDTGEIMININRFNFVPMKAARLNEELIVDKSYVFIRGEIRGSYRFVDVKAIHNLGEVL